MTGKVRFATIVAVALLTAASASAQQATPAPAPASTSEVATVKSTNGKVLLNRATAYDPAAKDQRLVVGDRLVVLEGGAITVRFDDGCDQIIDDPSIYTVTTPGDTKDLTFKSERVTSGEGDSVWTGTVHGKDIEGKLIWTKNDGAVYTYSFKGDQLD